MWPADDLFLEEQLLFMVFLHAIFKREEYRHI